MDFSVLIPTLAQYGAPLIAKLLETAAYATGGPLVGGVATLVLDAVAKAVGAPSSSPADIQATIQSDPAKAQAALPQVQSDHADLINAAISQAQIDEQNLESARTMEADLVKGGSVIAWGAPVVSVIAVMGFVVVSCLVFVGHGGDTVGGQQILGAMTVGWTTVLTYWLGSSKGSSDKTGALMSIAHAALGKSAPASAPRRAR